MAELVDLRTRLAVGAVELVNRASRRLGRGQGTVAGGQVGLAIQPRLVSILSAGRPLAVVTGTNGKTTTTALLAAALAGLGDPVVVNATGSNMPSGHAAALAGGPDHGPVVLEVDEGYVPALLASRPPEALVLLNLSRDQLDRTSEVRMVAGRWRQALQGTPTTVVANADDPLVAWGAGTAATVRWVAAGMRWISDAVGCPACGGRISFPAVTGTGEGWSCACGFRRPEPQATVVDGPSGEVRVLWRGAPAPAPIPLAVPGRFNQANAVMAAEAAGVLGVPRKDALAAMATVPEVAGRFARVSVAGVPSRLLLAKNPAGWLELLELVDASTAPVVLAINARVADGRDPSWLWDVPFERLRGRPVVAAGERCLDLSVRLRYAEVPHQTIRGLVGAVATAGRSAVPGRTVDFIGNYTAFHQLWASPRCTRPAGTPAP